ncbi:Fpg/Nei family DNA glycosylase [Actinomycetospora termitidis]|uniref:DNA-(apurinic or apyrimidinic site) lyase n=1 Tax=Actinomycetospora termitidis TaxID=3053470 RepID=A0ABT7MGZ7_9PSEU|nr:DNA-formamidopyrimidine glycosylase family protein [Actinomycetospora sp. Odt1-22]MDL5159952.1 DNA-formamidopyrimidine glycosylase family protein [Actinomycetospora sp. Odt1-22]
MPEGHTIRRLARSHARHFRGKPVGVSSPQGRFLAGAELVDGRVLRDVDAHGKHLFHVYEADLVVHVHLGLYGKFSLSAVPDEGVPAPWGQVRMRLVGPTHFADLRGATACEVLTESDVETLHARLGADPLRPDADPERVWARVSRSRAPIATLLMDQAVIAGVGNVYRAEVLFRHGLDPLLEGRALGRARFDAVWDDLRELLQDGVRRGSIRTLRPEHADLAQERPVYVYRRDGRPCLLCGTEIVRATHVARNLFWCPSCQNTG